MRSKLIQFRNHLAPSNRFRISGVTTFENNANILKTAIDSVGRNEIVFEEGVRLRNLSIAIRGETNLLRISKDAIVAGRIELYGDGNSVTIGARTHINGAFLGAHNGKSIIIGSDCLFSTEVDMRTTDSHGIFDETGHRLNPDKDIVVGDRVWIGLGVTLLKGARIASDCVVGARSVVVGEIPANTVSAGVPARVLRGGVTWKA